MNISIRIEGLDQFTEALALLASAVGVNKDTSFTAPAPVTPAQEIADPAVPVAPTPAPVATVAPAYTLDDLSRAGVELMDIGKTDAVVALLHEFGVDSLPNLGPGRYGEFATRLRGLGANI